MKKLFFLVILVGIAWLFSACNKQVSTECQNGSWNNCEILSLLLDHSDFTWSIQAVLLAIKTQDFATLATFVWSQWLRFSPYEYVNTGTDIVLTSGQIANALSMSGIYTWGSYDGSWEPINLTIGQYFTKFVNDADYATAPQVLYNQSMQRGNIINNIAQVYVGKQWVESHFTWFDPQYEGIDRKSLTLVFENIGGQWYLIGIVHGQRTI